MEARRPGALLGETWLVDLPGERVEVDRTPVPDDGYRDVRVLQRGQSLTAETFPDLRPQRAVSCPLECRGV